MSEGVESQGGGRKPSLIKGPREFWGGVALVVLAVFALIACYDLPGMRGFAFGPGTAPRMFAVLLGAFGVIIAAVGVMQEGPGVDPAVVRGAGLALILVLLFAAIDKFAEPLFTSIGYRNGESVAASFVVLVVTVAFARGIARGPLYVTAGVLIFAGTIRTLGLIPASFISTVVAAFATHEVRVVETLIWAAVLTAFCAFLFPYALNLPFNFWPQF